MRKRMKTVRGLWAGLLAAAVVLYIGCTVGVDRTGRGS